MQPWLDPADASMVNRMRLLLSTSCLLTLYVDPEVMGRVNGFAAPAFAIYLLHSLLLAVTAPQRWGRVVNWLDVAWFYLIVLITGGVHSFFYLFFFFSILSTAFRYGYADGARITLVSTLLFTSVATTVSDEVELSRVLLRAMFLLALGYMISHWGGMMVSQRRRLAMLHEVSQQSNPRFGVDHTIASVLEKTRVFYRASSCILLLREADNEHWSLRAASAANAGRTIHANRLTAEAAAPLLSGTDDGRLLLYAQPRDWLLRRRDQALTLQRPDCGWQRVDAAAAAGLAELLEARSLMALPVPLRQGEGRLLVVAAGHDFTRQDLLFLEQIGGQAFAVIENIALLDRMATEAVVRERERIARDIHDSTIQPYIGLRHGLSALRKQAAPDNPLLPELDSLLLHMAQVIGDLRRYAKSFRGGDTPREPELMLALRRQASQVKEFYGIDITVQSQGQLAVNDRLAAEVFQIVNEGMSNIRKHTEARHGAVTLECVRGTLRVRIENDCAATTPAEFLPQSIAERANALGGSMRVKAGADRRTLVEVLIPV
jgi:signal transduction histidine kinase